MCSERFNELSVLESINRALLELGPDHRKNVKKLLNLCGELTGAFFVIYSRSDNNQFQIIGKYTARPDLEDIDFSECSICKEIINVNSDSETVITNLQESLYAENNCFIKSCNLKTYLGKSIRSEGELLGALCLFYDQDFVPNDDCIRVIGIIGALMGNEDKRMRDHYLLERNNHKIRALMEASSKASQVLISNINFDDAVNQVLDIIGEATRQDRTEHTYMNFIVTITPVQ